PRLAADAVEPARGHGGAPGDRRREDAHPPGAFLRRGDTEPRRAGWHVSPPRSADRPLPPEDRAGVPEARRGGEDPRGASPGAPDPFAGGGPRRRGGRRA